MPTKLWQPSDARVRSTALYDFAAQYFDGDPTDYQAIWKWSVEDLGAFWSAVWDYTGIIGEKGEIYFKDKGDIKTSKFFPDAKLNYAENLLLGGGTGTAIVYLTEDGKRISWSWDRLRAEVSSVQQALRASGIVAGDRVAGFVPNSPYAIAAMLGVTSLGAIWSSCSPDFGFNGVQDRFGQIAPKLLFCADHYLYNGKQFDCLETAKQLKTTIPSLQQIIAFPYAQDNFAAVETLTSWDAFTDPFEPTDLEFTRVGFDDPLVILFSSGTTGLPKCIVHSVGGLLLKHVEEHVLNCDLKEGDRFFYFTTCGWMMWNWLVTGLASKAVLYLFDGSPFYPDGTRLSELARAEQITHFGASAKYYDACAKAGVKPNASGELTELRAIYSTGSPLAPESFDYLYRDWKSDMCLSSIAGGTDICGCFTGGAPISPVYRGECQQRILGMDVQVFDSEGQIETDGPGELVCVSPHPAQPVGFWGDETGEKYHNAYFAKFPNVWHHGDFVEITETGGAVFYGRSDAVLNPGGVRIGTAEIYRQVERIDEVLEAIVVGQNWQSDVRVVLFVRLRDGVDLDDNLITRIKTEIRENATPRHMPAKILAVADIPRTKSGKITELAVRDIIHGRAVKNTTALANPEALDLYKNLAELQV
ncbi:MAG: acetoacetate--CoA ligase [Pseudomonadota bacterium]